MRTLYTTFYNELISFISEFSGVDLDSIKDESCITSDLHITGDDAADLIIAYGKRFDVDVREFKADEYFKAEGWDILNAIFQFFMKKNNRSIKKSLKVKHLVKGMIAGKLNDEIIMFA